MPISDYIGNSIVIRKMKKKNVFFTSLSIYLYILIILPVLVFDSERNREHMFHRERIFQDSPEKRVPALGGIGLPPPVIYDLNERAYSPLRNI